MPLNKYVFVLDVWYDFWLYDQIFVVNIIVQVNRCSMALSLVVTLERSNPLKVMSLIEYDVNITATIV